MNWATTILCKKPGQTPIKTGTDTYFLHFSVDKQNVVARCPFSGAQVYRAKNKEPNELGNYNNR